MLSFIIALFFNKFFTYILYIYIFLHIFHITYPAICNFIWRGKYPTHLVLGRNLCPGEYPRGKCPFTVSYVDRHVRIKFRIYFLRSFENLTAFLGLHVSTLRLSHNPIKIVSAAKMLHAKHQFQFLRG